jgi:flagellar basal body-associated protein FliL
MKPDQRNPEDAPSRTRSRIFFIMLAIIIAAFAAFLILRPVPPGAHGKSTTTQH